MRRLPGSHLRLKLPGSRSIKHRLSEIFDCRARLPATRSFLELVPDEVKSWLLDPGSLTAKLRRASRGEFRVQVISRRRAHPFESERRWLGLAPRRYALIREVILSGYDTPWVFARSVLPYSSLTGRYRRLRILDDRPLGAILHTDPSIHRGDMEIFCLPPDWPGYPPEIGPVDEPAWGRRSLYQLRTGPILVGEIFLPGIHNSPWNEAGNPP